MPETICLDNLSFSDLIKDALEKRAEYTSQWKYTKESDLGITLLEMMAVMTDLQGYHADSVTEAHLRQYANLLSAGARGQKCAIIAFKNMEIQLGTPDGRRLPQVGAPLSVDGHIFEYSRMTEDGYVFIQKDTKTDFREFLIEEGNKGIVRLRSYQARQSAIDGSLKVFEFVGGVWVRNYGFGVKINDGVVEAALKPGRFRIVYGQHDKPLGTASGVSSQTITPPYKSPLPQALKLWAGDGRKMHDIGYTLSGELIVLGNGGDFPILPENTDVYACRLVLSDGEVSVSKKNTVKHSKHFVFSSAEVLCCGAVPESAEDALKRFRDNKTYCAVTSDDYRLLAAGMTGLNPDDIIVDMGAGTVNIAFFAPVDGLDNIRRRLNTHKPLGVRLTVESAMRMPVKLRGEIDLYEDHPANRKEAADAIDAAVKSYFLQSSCGTSINILLQKTLSGMDIVRRARVEVSSEECASAGVFMPEPDMEEIKYV